MLEGTTRPIVLLRRRRGHDEIAASVAPHLDELGVMLPYTPLHHLLLAAFDGPLVMTSGNVSDEPIAKNNDEAVQRLGHIADAFLLHDRDIYARYDDFVVRRGGRHRAHRRGERVVSVRCRYSFVPSGHRCSHSAPISRTRSPCSRTSNAFTGPHIGDLDSPVTLTPSRRGVAHVPPSIPRAAGRRRRGSAPRLRVDAPRRSVVEPRRARGARAAPPRAHRQRARRARSAWLPCIGVAFDGVGLGTDQTIWGGEFLLCDERSYRRIGHIAPVRQPGGDACAREGWRMAVAYLAAAGELGDRPPRGSARRPTPRPSGSGGSCPALACSDSAAAPLSTSAGRLFDAVASLLGVAQVSTFEARRRCVSRRSPQPQASELSSRCGRDPRAGDPLVLDTVAARRDAGAGNESAGGPADELCGDLPREPRAGDQRGVRAVGAELGVDRVALSGGVFQNALLLARVETAAPRARSRRVTRTTKSLPTTAASASDRRWSLLRKSGRWPDMIVRGGARSRRRTRLRSRLRRLSAVAAVQSRPARRSSRSTPCTIAACAAAMADRFFAGATLFVFGSGPHATDAQHNSVEYVHPVLPGCRALPGAVAHQRHRPRSSGWCTESDAAAEVYAHQLRVLGRPGDIALGFAHAPLHPSIARGLEAGTPRRHAHDCADLRRHRRTAEASRRFRASMSRVTTAAPRTSCIWRRTTCSGSWCTSCSTTAVSETAHERSSVTTRCASPAPISCSR